MMYYSKIRYDSVDPRGEIYKLPCRIYNNNNTKMMNTLMQLMSEDIDKQLNLSLTYFSLMDADVTQIDMLNLQHYQK